MLDLKKVYTPDQLDEALDLMARETLRVMAGGTDLLVDLRHKVLTDTSVVALGRIKELKGIQMEADHLWIGALTTFTEIIESDLIQSAMPELAHAAATIAGPQIRNVATLGGNVTKGAVSADSIPILLVYDTLARIQSKHEIREVPLAGIFTGPGTTNLKRDELLTGFIIPADTLNHLSAHYIKHAVRKSMDLAMLGVAVGLTLQDGLIGKLRCALAVAAPVPLRLLRDEDWAGRKPDEDTIAAVISEIEGKIQIRDSWRASREYRGHLIKVLFREAFSECLAKAKGKTNG